ncbi:hypothetical protein EVAR_47717_1 [Eumeta japonica]|uniref:Uncharacterized protein n=1 Tax=Eumeta variegata TaxID=151549 RepID=A0A4C1VWW0_EUMVA|nr:hypothetical protein EVAR_47717_1 [Eumeta japonica]
MAGSCPHRHRAGVDGLKSESFNPKIGLRETIFARPDEEALQAEVVRRASRNRLSCYNENIYFDIGIVKLFE